MNFVNISNHPAKGWSDAQRDAALEVAQAIRDIPFPQVPTEADEAAVSRLADETADLVAEDERVALVQGEFTLAFAVVKRLQARGVRCLAATSERLVEQVGEQKVVTFRFAGFRAYEAL